MRHTGLKVLGALVLGALLAGGVSVAAAPPPPGGAGFTQNLAPARAAFMHRFNRGRLGGMRGPVAAVIADLRSMRRLYLLQGQRQKIPDLYRYVLGKTQNPALRNYAYQQLARSQLQVTNADAAIATLRQSLDENLARVKQTANAKP